MTRRTLWLVSCLLLVGWPAPAQAAQPQLGRTLVLAAQDDPYYSLAEEISRAEGLEIVRSFDDARARNPEFVLWVIAPAKLSERVFVDLGLAARASGSSIAIGIISGSTLERAHQLWSRRTDVRGERVFAANGEYPAARVFQGRIQAFNPAGTRVLTRESLRGVLQEADYLTFTGHGGPGYLSLAPGNAMRARDIPPLPPVVVGTASCQTFQLWRPGSIALAFADQGAAAYVGFAFSPNEGFLMGEFDGLPFRYTWPEFPIGHVMLVQARGTLRGFAAFSYYYLLGDPRISLRSDPAYRVAEDREVGNDRLVTIADAPAGILPIRISGGARYRFAEIPGVASAGDDDPFYDARLQTANVGDAKYLLFKHAGGGFTLRLRRDVPAPRAILDPLLDSLDNALIFLYQNESRYFGLVVGLVVWLGIGWRTWRRKTARDGAAGRRALLIALAAGLALAALHGAYAWVRLDNFAINEKPVAFGWPPVAGTGLLVAGAALMYLRARTRRGRVAAILVANLPLIGGAVFVTAAMFLVNSMSARQYGAGLWNYSLARMALLAAAVQVVVTAAVFATSRRSYVATADVATLTPSQPAG